LPRHAVVSGTSPDHGVAHNERYIARPSPSGISTPSQADNCGVLGFAIGSMLVGVETAKK
jgi:hypothetical protein